MNIRGLIGLFPILVTTGTPGQVPSWTEACSVAYSDTIVDGIKTYEIIVVGDSALYMFGVHPGWENFVNARTTGPPVKVVRRALEAVHDEGVTIWIQQMCGNAFVAEEVSGMLYLDLDETGWSTTWTSPDYRTYWQRFTLLKGDTRKCFDRLQSTRPADL